MKLKIIIALFISVTAYASDTIPEIRFESPKTQILDVARLLRCIADVETGSCDNVKGKAHEQTRWQLTPIVWRQHSKLPFNYNKKEAERVAYAHIKWISDNIKQTDRNSPYVYAIVWNGGLSRLYKQNYPQRTIDYAERVSRLYLENK